LMSLSSLNLWYKKLTQFRSFRKKLVYS